ncbi:MAG: protein-disulfide reductase DsbD domain-containing protein [Pseudomonadota bacterium]
MRSLRLILFTILALWCGAAAAQSNRVDTEYASSIIVPERTALSPGETQWFAFSQQLAPNWHVYWKNPGDSGLPLDLRWTLPDGVTAGEILYPTPERIPVGPLANFGHHGEPVFLIPITVDASVKPGQSLSLSVDATWLICEEICVPEEGAFSLLMLVEPNPSEHPDGARLVRNALEAAPVAFDGRGTFEAADNALTVRLESPAAFGDDVFFFPDQEGLIEPAAAQKISRDGDVVSIVMAPGFAYEPAALSEITGVLATTDGKSPQGVFVTFEKSAAGGGATSAGATAAAGGNVIFLLAAAFFGGVLLNIMPCVFPIIFVKAASLMKSAQADRQAIRRHGLLYTIGIVAMFALLGGALLLLRAGGEQLGWGFHLQSPFIVALSAYVLFLVGLNLAGVFEIGESLQNVGGGFAEKSGDAGAFFTGVLAVVVAAPCIGPFLSAPVGAAVFLPPVWGMLIFIVMALGLAAPYLLLSFSPGLGRLLPKPGAWMATLKQLLSFPVFAAAAYFLWVLAQQAGAQGLAAGLMGAVALAFAAWLFQRSKNEGSLALAARAGAALALVAAIAPVASLGNASEELASAGGKHGAFETLVFDETMIDAYRAEGRPVFVDFTAAWCVTCQFNKLTIFSKPSLARAFADNDVAFMVADWTRRDEKITKALEAFGANGVPLYVYYPPEGDPKVLPLPLTERSVRDTVGG